MAGKFITKTQQSHVAGLITGLVAALDAKGMPWTRQHKEDLKLAFQALGVDCPFSFSDVQPGQPPARLTPLKRLYQSAKDKLGMP